MVLSIAMDDTQIEVIDKPKKLDAVGLHYYGERFVGYQKVGEIVDLIPVFKGYYYEKRIDNINIKRGMLLEIVQGFNKDVAYPQGRLFHPYTTQLRWWTKKWDADIIRQKFQMKEETSITPEKEIRQIVKVRGEEYAVSAPGDGELESGLRTLGGELLNDAMQMLRDDQELEEVYGDEMLIKRRNYVVNVFSHATKLVHGKAALMLKASADKRDTASFLMNLLSKATAGTLTDSEVGVLEVAYTERSEANAGRGEVSTEKNEQPTINTSTPVGVV